jgi:hypothetical protein
MAMSRAPKPAGGGALGNFGGGAAKPAGGGFGGKFGGTKNLWSKAKKSGLLLGVIKQMEHDYSAWTEDPKKFAELVELEVRASSSSVFFFSRTIQTVCCTEDLPTRSHRRRLTNSGSGWSPSTSAPNRPSLARCGPGSTSRPIA